MKKSIKQNNMKNTNNPVSRSTSNGMKKLPKIIGIILMFLFFSSFALNIVYAATPTMTVQRIANQENGKTNKWAWVFKITTTNISDKTNILINIYKDGVLDTEQVKEKVSNNEALYYTDSVLDTGSNYRITFEVEKSDLKAEYSAIAGDSKKEEVVYFDPKAGTGDSSVYKLLAPIGEFIEAPDNIGDYFNTIFKIAIGLCGALAVIMIIIGGVQYMGDESIFGKTEAKSRIMSAILGLLIALGSWALLNTINPDLLGGGGVNIKKVEVDITEAEAVTSESMDVANGIPVGSCRVGLQPVIVNGSTIMRTCGSITSKVQQLIIDIKKEKGITLSGNSFRSYAGQVEARRKNGCPDIYNSPPGDCKVPTAIPGNSLHQSGLAIDFICNSGFINPKKRPNTQVCFDWLKANASKYGLSNLASEPWHWSTTGQ